MVGDSSATRKLDVEMACWTCSPSITTHGLGQQLLPDVRQEGDRQQEQAEICCHLNSGQRCPWAEHQR